ncbi:metallophosphoesterase [Winogradskyella jejuensis]|uniref:Phosphoesterase n=1 Tax=Winogradskyella jejuensis TaxID=1089305 RepID=A0A1M5MT53_9FLAO|nr:metallophosphoesterase [Winogradskyella jejuensis]SHG80498.1 hypothetical protein SAMN05444148_0989 [Winogradskyella jejuensis]
MKIGIYSDVHDNVYNLKKTLKYFKENGIKETFFCGDFCSPIPAKIIGDSGIKTYCVFGNGDGDRFTILNLANTKFSNLIISPEYTEIKVNEKKIVMTHYPFYAQSLAKNGEYDLVLCGHTHEPKIEKFSKTIFINPGEVMGWNGNPTFVVYDFESKNTDLIKINDI